MGVILLSFLAAILGRQSDAVRPSRRNKMPKDFRQEQSLHFRSRASEFCENAKEVRPSAPCNGKFNQPSWCNCHQFGYPSVLLFNLCFCGILKVTDLIAKHSFYIVHIFGKHGLLYSILGLKMELYILSQEERKIWLLEKIFALSTGIF